MSQKSLALMGASLLVVSLAGCAATGNGTSSNNSANHAANTSSSMMDVASGMLSQQSGESLPAADLMSSLTSQLGVSSTQALGGSAAMLSLAQSQLGSDTTSALASEVPQLASLTNSSSLSTLSSLAGLGGNDDTSALASTVSGVDDSAALDSAFSMLGMDSDMVSQFAPVLLNYMGGEGVSSNLLNSLSSVWGTGS